MGTAVIGGMLFSSGIAIFVIPALFYVVEKLSGGAKEHAKCPTEHTQPLQPSTAE